ncbi:hypothetical protein OSB04_un001705 [Centaurea solstitialis]|uniref:Transmembrane protein n=1 Tax=Centaurea solstitialis TaxID=347529 RepID=A0AA38SFP8_9ASTR|nr:hypothetical protein OSB04_un001705 [Centaurea solstitialis]
MKNNNNHHNNHFSMISLFKFFNAPLHLINLLSILLFFAFGLCFGIILSFHLKNVSFNLQFTQFSLSTITSAASSAIVTPPQSTAPPAVKVGLKNYLNPPELMHDMSDEELLWRASMVPKVTDYPYKRIPKVAFMFLTKGPVVLSPVWDRFFGGNEGYYNVYVHRSNSSSNATEPEDSVFHGRRIPSKMF